MLHEPSVSSGPDHASGYKTRVGMYMFIVYALVYAGFVIINLCSPLLMEKIILFGMNVATVYGFGLIVFALILALIYNNMCAKEEDKYNNPMNQKGGQ